MSISVKEEISEKEVLHFLENKATQLKQELKRTQDALNALKRTVTLASGIPKVAKEIKKLKKSFKTPEVPEFYSASYRWDSKILYVLSQNAALYKNEVAQQLLILEPETNQQKLQSIIAVRLSVLFKNGNIKADKEGKKLKYHL